MALINIIDYLAFESARNKLLSLSQAFRDAIIRVVNSENAEFNADLESFESNINTIILNGTIGEALQTLFNSYELVGNTANDQYILSKEMFDFGDTDTQTNLSPKQATNNTAINNGVQINALAQGYNNAVQINFGNEEELEERISELDAQYKKLIERELDQDTRVSLLNIRTLSNTYFSTLDLKSIIEIETKTIPSTVLSYKYYKDSTQADQIISLNKIQNTGFVEGTIKILST